MRSNLGKWIFAIVIIIVVIGVGVFIFENSHKTAPEVLPTTEPVVTSPKHQVIGQSVEGRNIDSYTYLPAGQAGGNGATHLLFVGGIHGGYEWNSVLLAYTFMDYLEANPDIIPSNLTVTVIPDANPDAVFLVTGKEGRFTSADVSTSSTVLASGRFNADDVDLNRNFDCKWQPKGTWQTKTVSGGTAAFSEPETRAIRDFVLDYHPAAAIFWHSQSDAVYASQCLRGILPGTIDIMNAYSAAAGYPAVKTFDAYGTTGAADDWMASIGMPAITVELQTHDTIEWARNLAGIKAILGYYSRQIP
jgi:predicted deacylase